MDTATKEIRDELKLIRQELSDIKRTMPDKDMFLNAEEARLLNESIQHEHEGTLTSGKDLRKELGL
jgi:hypothetical protein